MKWDTTAGRGLTRNVATSTNANSRISSSAVAIPIRYRPAHNASKCFEVGPTVNRLSEVQAIGEVASLGSHRSAG